MAYLKRSLVTMVLSIHLQNSNNSQKSTGFAHYQQPTLPPEQWPSRDTCEDHQKLLRNAEDLFLSLLSYKATSLPWCNLSPAELLTGPAIRTNVPQLFERFIPKWSCLEKFRQDNSISRPNRSQTLTNATELDRSWTYPSTLKYGYSTGDHLTSGHIAGTDNTPRPYLVHTPQGLIRRNRSSLIVMPNINQPDTREPRSTFHHSPIMT